MPSESLPRRKQCERTYYPKKGRQYRCMEVFVPKNSQHRYHSRSCANAQNIRSRELAKWGARDWLMLNAFEAADLVEQGDEPEGGTP